MSTKIQTRRITKVRQTLAMASASLLAGLALAADPSVLTITVEAGKTNSLDEAISSTVTKLVKQGPGGLKLTKAAQWDAGLGEVEVQAGTLIVGSYANMGDPAKVTVSGGATIDFTGLAAGIFNSSYLQTTFYVTGNGCEGAGALRYTATGAKNHALLKLVKLMGDTKIVGPTYSSAIGENDGWGIGQHGASSPVPNLDMGGHKLTIEGAFCFGNSSAANNNTVSNPGDIELRQNARLIMPSMKYLTVDGTGATEFPTPNGKTITMNNGSKMFVYMLRNAPTLTWTVAVPEGASVDYYHLNNDEGEKRGNVYMPFAVDGTLNVHAYLSASAPIHFLSGITGKGKVVNHNLASSATIEARVEVVDGFKVGEVSVTRGTMVFKDAGVVSVTNFYQNSGMLYGTAETILGSGADDYNNNIARLRLTGNTHFGAGDGAFSNHAIMVGKDKYGILEVTDGATVSNMIYLARKNGDYGALWLSGEKSEIYWPSTADNRSLIGDEGYGCVMMSGGRVTMTGKVVLLGRNGGSGYWFQTGGTTEVKDDYFWLARPNAGAESTADLHVQGGSFEAGKGIRCMYPESGTQWYNTRAVVTVGGGSAPASLKTTFMYVYCTRDSRGSTALINVNENGSLTAETICRQASPENNVFIPWDTYDWSPTKLYLNFNGGTLVFAADKDEFFGSVGQCPQRTLVYVGGATFDTAGHNVGFASALEKPTGKGIASVTLPASCSGTSGWYLGTSRLIGSWGSVSGVVDFNTANRSANGGVITSPGSGLPNDITVSVLDRFRNKVACQVFLAELATTGGVIKKGVGTLTLKGANTYGGTTRVECGTLAFTHAAGYPGGDLEIPASALASDAPAFVTAVNFALSAGKKIRIVGVTPETIRELSDSRRRTLVMAQNAMDASLTSALELTDENGQPVSATGLRLTLADGGKTLKFGMDRGLAVIVR